MTTDQIRIGQWVTNNVAFSNVPIYSRGIIDFDYGTGVEVVWDLEDWKIPENYMSMSVTERKKIRLLRDGFDKETELQYLDLHDPNEEALIERIESKPW